MNSSVIREGIKDKDREKEAQTFLYFSYSKK
jgi:hypothetical protein